MRTVVVTRIPQVFLGFHAVITSLGHEVAEPSTLAPRVHPQTDSAIETAAS